MSALLPIDPLALNPFAALTMVAAPAILTNASSVLAMSTSNRFLRASERIRGLRGELAKLETDSMRARFLRAQVPRIEKQSVLLLSGLGSSYIGLGSFASAALVSLIGAAAGSYSGLRTVSTVAVVAGLIAGVVGVSALVFGCLRLFQATRLSMLNIRDEAECIRQESAALL